VPVYDVVDDEESPAIVFQYVDGESLADRIHRVGPMPVEEATGIARQVAEALDHAHRAGLVHRDVKPANIVLDDGDRARLVDFGIARVLADASAHLTSAGEVMGTLRYMAPEQLRGQPVDARTDVYALGLVLVEMLSGKPAIEAATPAALPEAQAGLSDRLVDLAGVRAAPSWLAELLERLLEVEPERRPDTAADVAGAIERREAPPSLEGRIGEDDPTISLAAVPIATAAPGRMGDAAPASETVASAAAPESAIDTAPRQRTASAGQRESIRGRPGGAGRLAVLGLVVAIVLGAVALFGRDLGSFGGAAPVLTAPPLVEVTPTPQPEGENGAGGNGKGGDNGKGKGRNP
jgi:serine/threonine protein kinase